MTDVETGPSPRTRGSGPRSRRGLWIGIAAVVAVLVAGTAVWYFVFRDDAPPAPDVESAARAVEDTRTDTGGNGATDATDLEGTWVLDTDIGDFDVSTDVFTSAFVGYRVREELAGIGAKTAVGRTPDVEGTLTIEGTTATAAEITADLTTLASDDSRRDGQLRNQALQTSQFPTATFRLTEPIDFGEVPDAEAPVTVDATGELTLHGVTRSVTVPLEARLVGDTIVVTGLMEIVFADFDIARPTAALVLSVEDRGEMELQLFFRRT